MCWVFTPHHSFMISQLEVNSLNQKLLETYGLLHDKPRFRLVWSDSQLEMRFGEVDVFYGVVFVRKDKGAHEFPKYPNNKERWVLETMAEGWNPELGTSLSYEPIWVFQTFSDKYVDPNWRAINVVIYSILNPTVATPSDIKDAEQKAMEKEYELFYNQLDDETPYLANMLHHREAVINPWAGSKKDG